MTLHPPRSNARTARDSALGYEIAQEQAAALGRLGRALELALAALSRHDHVAAQRAANAADHPLPAGEPREQLVQAASDALWCFIVQREACGLRDHRSIIRAYGVPAEVHNRMGAFGKSASTRA
jgi:hypothetical protein